MKKLIVIWRSHIESQMIRSKAKSRKRKTLISILKEGNSSLKEESMKRPRCCRESRRSELISIIDWSLISLLRSREEFLSQST
jgi:hypothetical protein